MSSRALRRARQELDIKPDPVAAEGSHDKSEEEVDTEYNHGHGRFDLLYEAASSDNESSVNDDYEGKTESDRHSAETASTKKPINKVSRKKKAKRKASQKRKETDLDDGNVVEDLDRILEALSFKVRKKSEDHAPITGSLDDAFFSLLAINTRDLHIQNEMKRLFGKIVTDHSSAPVAEGSGGRRAAGDRRARIARNQLTGGRGIPFITLKRNPFIEGKEEWLQILGVGLAMEKMEEGPNGATTYTTVHRPIYQDIQRQFILCVASMDPESLIQLHQSHPSHVATLLQISEIAKQQSDHTLSKDRLEKALFMFGRCVTPDFVKKLSQGKARLDFNRFENREVWLAAWRYIDNLRMQGTWRTVFEWSKLLFSLDPVNDPYAMYLVLDQYALRANQDKAFIALAENSTFASSYGLSLNIRASLSLAYARTGATSRANEALATIMRECPWVFSGLFKELNISPLPASIWGKMPRTPEETLVSELYIKSVKDLWNTREHIELLKHVAAEIGTAYELPDPDTTICGAHNVARHVLLMNDPSLISHLPREITSSVDTSYDILPPLTRQHSYLDQVQGVDRAAAAVTPLPVNYDRDVDLLRRAHAILENTDLSAEDGLFGWDDRLREAGIPLETLRHIIQRLRGEGF